MTPDELRAAAERILRFLDTRPSRSNAADEANRDFYGVCRGLLASLPPADCLSPITADWLASVVPGFAQSDSGVGGATGDGWRLIAHRKPAGWAFLVSGDGCDAARICPTRGEARAMFRLFGVPLTPTPETRPCDTETATA